MSYKVSLLYLLSEVLWVYICAWCISIPHLHIECVYSAGPILGFCDAYGSPLVDTYGWSPWCHTAVSPRYNLAQKLSSWGQSPRCVLFSTVTHSRCLSFWSEWKDTTKWSPILPWNLYSRDILDRYSLKQLDPCMVNPTFMRTLKFTWIIYGFSVIF